MLKEFDIIKQYFTRKSAKSPEIIQGIGDDAAVWQCAGAVLVTSVDTLVEGRHFFADCLPEDLAYKALAVNLSDFAAMGATPRWFTLALTLPKAEALWLEKFSNSLFALADEYRLNLIGGDTTQGPLCVTIQIIGTVDPHKMLLRSGAKVGDAIYVSGILGDAALALRDRQNKTVQEKLNRPKPQVELGLALGGHAHAAIDISDGLAQDLNHILQASGVGADIFLEKLPISTQGDPLLALSGGDDYELCFTLAKDNPILAQLASQYCLTCIGEITENPGLRIYQKGQLIKPEHFGWQHFH